MRAVRHDVMHQHFEALDFLRLEGLVGVPDLHAHACCDGGSFGPQKRTVCLSRASAALILTPCCPDIFCAVLDLVLL